VARALVEAADVVAFDRNPNPMGFLGFEDSRWHFTDGTSSFDVAWAAGSAASGPVVAVGSVDRFPYATFFGLQPLGFDAGFGFLLFDLDLVGIDARSPAFRVTIGADPASGQIPDPEAVGRINAVPEPATFGLLAAGLIALRRRSRPACGGLARRR
jgi:hypothetical protein